MYPSIEVASGLSHRAVRTGSNSAIARLSQPGQDPRDLLELARDSAPGRLGDVSVPDGPDHALQLLGGDLVVVDVVHGEHRRLVACCQTLLLFQGEQAILGHALRLIAQQLAGPVVQAASTEQRTRRIRTDGDDVLPAGM